MERKCIRVAAVLLLASALGACGGRKTAAKGPVPFPAALAPSCITDRMEKACWLSDRYWSGFFRLRPQGSDSSLVHGVSEDQFARAFCNYLDMLSFLRHGAGEMEYIGSQQQRTVERSVEVLFRGLDSLASAGERRPLLRVMDLGERFLYQPDSPLLDEELYLPFVNRILASPALTGLEKMPYRYQQTLCSLNRTGTPAADFSFVRLLSNGSLQKGTLYRIRAPYTLLFFNNPDCPSCAAIREQLKDSPLEDLSQAGTLQVLAMYIDENLQPWKRERTEYPSRWIYAHDPGLVLRDNQIYGLRAIPSLYLLDARKRVVLKDASVAEVIRYLSSGIQDAGN